VEGRFYVWDHPEVLEVGGPAAVEWYGVTPAGNWEGHNILIRALGAPLERPVEVEAARQALFARREERVRPGLDDKVLTEWNAMVIAALAEAGAALGEPAWLAAAEEIGEFLITSLQRPDGRWLRSWQAGTAKHLAYAADHAWLVEAFLRLTEATGRSRWVAAARHAADDLIRLYWDAEARTFRTSATDAEALIARPVDTYDGALPSANSVAATALLRLAAVTGEARYQEHAQAVVDAMGPALGAAPLGFTGMVAAADLARTGLVELVVTGERPDLLAAARARFLPGAVVAWGEPFDSPLWEGRTGPDTAGLAFVCRDYVCQAPVSDPGALVATLEGATR
jgi:uncharacterized protein YyaL (SSP411 family)